MARRALAACAARLLSQPSLLPRGFAASAAPAASLAAQPQPEAPRAASSSDKPAVPLPAEAQGPLKPRPWGAESKRTGVLGIKCGMTAEWTAWGERLPLTVVWLDDCQVTQVKTEAKEGYTAVQVGVGSKKAKQVTKPLAGHFLAAGLPIKRHLAEFRVTPDALLPVGTQLAAAHFKAGQYVDVSGTTIGKGFAGVMKRWNFRGQGASHGNSLAHRALGSTGGRQDPGRTWKGKKMPGRMGNERRTVHSLLVQRVDGARGLLYLHGQVPGHSGGVLEVKDALRKPPTRDATVPFPTYVEPQPGALAAMEPQVAPVSDDPFDRVRPVRNDSKTGS